MMHGSCRCFHHWVTKLLVILAWLSAFGFWWTSWKTSQIWWMDAEHFFQDVLILILLAFSTKFCGCCWKSKMTDNNMGGMCKHEGGCTCGDCGRCK